MNARKLADLTLDEFNKLVEQIVDRRLQNYFKPHDERTVAEVLAILTVICGHRHQMQNHRLNYFVKTVTHEPLFPKVECKETGKMTCPLSYYIALTSA